MDCGSRSFLGSQPQLRLLLNRVRRVPKRVLPELIGSSSVARMICSQRFVPSRLVPKPFPRTFFAGSDAGDHDL